MTVNKSNRRCLRYLGAVPLTFYCAVSGASMSDFLSNYVVDARTVVSDEAAQAISFQGNLALEWIRADLRIARLPPPAYSPDAT